MDNMFDEYYNAIGRERRRRMDEYGNQRPMWTSYERYETRRPDGGRMSPLPDDVTPGSLPDDIGGNAGGYTRIDFTEDGGHDDRDYTPGVQKEDLRVRLLRLQEENERLRAENERLSVGKAPDATEEPGDGAGDGDGEPTELDKANEEIKRITADFYNYRNRTRDDHDKAVSEGKAALLKAILPALDDIELIEMHDGLDERMSAVMGKLRSALSGMGAVEYGEKGEPFDPGVHHAVLTVDRADAPSTGSIDTIVSHGWTLDGAEVRPAAVVVAQPGGNGGAGGE